MEDDSDILNTSGHIGTFGTTRCGKSVLCEHICELKYFNDDAKIIDLTNDRVLEAVWSIRGTRMAKFKSILSGYNVPKEFKDVLKNGLPTEIMHPIVTTIPEKLPPLIKLYGIPMDFFQMQDVMRVLTSDSLGDASYTALSQEVKNLNANDSLPALPNKILDTTNQKVLKAYGMKEVPFYYFYEGGSSASSANRPILKVMDLGIFSSLDFEHAFTDRKIEDMLKDNRTVTGFSCRYIDDSLQKLKVSINLYLLDKIRKIAKQTNQNIVVYIKEARNLFPNAKTTDKGLKVLSDEAESMIKDCGKTGITLLLDTQSPNDLPEGVLDQISTKFIFRHDTKESNLIETYRGTPSLDTERVKNIKRLENFHFYVSSTKVGLSYNRFHGNTMDFKLTDHLEPKENELDYISKVQPKSTWYPTKDFIGKLAQNWLSTSNKYSQKFTRIHSDDQARLSSKILGIPPSGFKIMSFLYKNKKDKRWKFTKLLDLLAMPKSTLESAIENIHYKGFIDRQEGKKDGWIAISKDGLSFVEENAETFKI